MYIGDASLLRNDLSESKPVEYQYGAGFITKIKVGLVKSMLAEQATLFVLYIDLPYIEC